MNANIEKLHAIGQRVWLDNISRELLDSGTLARYIADLSVKGLTSNPTIFEHAISHSDVYDDAMRWARRTKAFSLTLRWTISSVRLIYSAPYSTPVAGWMAGCRSKFRRYLRMTRPTPSTPPESCMRGIEWRINAGLDPNIASVASLFVSRWDTAVKEQTASQFHNRLGIAIAMRTYAAYRQLLASARGLSGIHEIVARVAVAHSRKAF